MANNKSSGKNTKNDNLPGLIVKGSASQANDQKGIQLKSKKNSVNRIKKVFFQLRFHTSFGQELFVSGNHPLLGNGEIEKALPMQYFDEEHWNTSIEFKESIEAFLRRLQSMALRACKQLGKLFCHCSSQPPWSSSSWPRFMVSNPLTLSTH